MRRPVVIALSLAALTACGSTVPGATPPHSLAAVPTGTFHAPTGPVSPQPVREALVSRDGRTIVVPGRGGTCETRVSARVVATTPAVRILRTGHEPGGDLACLPVDLRLTRISLTLAQPLGNRRLIDDSTGEPIPTVSERSLLQPAYLPGNVTPALDLPQNGWTRVYGFPTVERHAPLFITQTPWPPMPDLTKMIGAVIQHVDVNGHPAILIDEPGPTGSTYVSWKVAGFTITVSSEPAASYQRPIPTAKVLLVARGLVVPRS